MLRRCVALKIVVANRLLQNNGKEMYKKSVLHVRSSFFLLITRVVLLFFTVLVVFNVFF